MQYLVRSVVLVGLSLGYNCSAHGQAFAPGYVVTSAGDTLRGQIENRYWQAPPENIVFRSSATAPKQTYPSSQVRAFRLEGGRYFRTEVVPLDRSARTQTSNLPQVLNINSQPEVVLAEVLVDGPVSLLRAVPDGVTHYFVRRPGKEYLELSERKYLTILDGRQRIMDANNYRALLNMYFGDCPAAVEAANKASYTAKSIAEVVQTFSTQCTINKSSGADYTTKGRNSRALVLNAGLLTGGNYRLQQLGTSNTGGEEGPLLDNLNVDGRLHPVIGLYIDALLPGRRWIGHGELTLSTFGRRETLPLAGGAGSYTWYGTNLDLRIGARYAFSQHPKREYFVGAGLNSNFTTSCTSQEQFGTGSSRVTTRNVRVPTQASFLGSPGFSPGPYLEVGARLARFTLTLDAYVSEGAGTYRDPLTVLYAFRNPNNPSAETSDYYGYGYGLGMLGCRAMLAFRLVGQHD